MKTAPLATPVPVCIRKGNCHAFWASAGTTLICHTGMVHLTGPALYLYENLHRMQCYLRAGEAHVVEQPGWLHCVALSDTRMMCLAPPPSRLHSLLEHGTVALAAQWSRWKPRAHPDTEHPGR